MTKINYNGKTIASLEAGQTATIKTANTEADHDIVITPKSPIEIAYGDIIATATAGQTATIKTAKTEVEHDIIISAKEEAVGYLTFSSPSAFTLSTANSQKNWNGTIEYSTDTMTWSIWDGTTTLSADGGILYLRGTGNTIITGYSNAYRWVLSGSNISCLGNIENLLDYATVASGKHPTMAKYCYGYIFYGCTSLISAPALPATTLTENCYISMFNGCTSLVSAPALPATTLASGCYKIMFNGCTSLISAPALPATTLASDCYRYMFNRCTSIKLSTAQTVQYQTPYRIPASGTGTTATYALLGMFDDTGGTFTGTPEINTTYYTSNEVVY